jgi:hypothetical protein
MSQVLDSAPLMLKEGAREVTRDQVLQAMAEFDRKGLREKIGDNRRGWSIEERGFRYEPKWTLKLATSTALNKFTHKQARETLTNLGFKLSFDPDWRRKMMDDLKELNADDDDGEVPEVEEAIEMTFGMERDLQRALRGNIEQLEDGLRIVDGGKEQVVDSGRGRIDVTAEDRNGTTVVIELKRGEAGRRAIGQILAYMGDLTLGKKPVRGILIARDFSPEAIAAARVVPSLQLRKYGFKFTFEAVDSN